MRSLRYFGLLLIVAAFACLGAAHSDQGAAPGTVRKLMILTASDPGFDQALDVDFPGLRSMDGFENIRPLLAYLRNDSGHGVRAYIVKWTISQPMRGGRVFDKTLHSMFETGADYRQPLMGEEIIWIQGRPRLVSPFFNWSTSPMDWPIQSKFLPSLEGSVAGILGPKGDFRNGEGVSVSIDAVVFDDYLFQGSDDFGFFAFYDCERKGEQQESQTILKMIQANASDADIASQLQNDEQQGGQWIGTNDESLTIQARGREAGLLAAQFKPAGRAGLEKYAAQVAQYSVTPLHRQ